MRKADYTFNSISIVKINPHRLRNTLLIVLIAILIVSLFSISTASTALRIIHDQGSGQVYPFSQNILPSFSSVSFFSSDKKVLLKGWFFEAPDSKKAIIFVHDTAQNRKIFGEDTAKVINRCLAENYSVLLFDQRNAGNIDDSRATLGLNERYDVEGAIAYAKALDMRSIYMIGFGSGANAVMNAEKPDELKGLILDAPYGSLTSGIKYVLKENERKTIFFTKTFTKLLLRIYDRAKEVRYTGSHFDDYPPVMLTRSGFSYLDTREEQKLFEKIQANDINTVLAALSSDSDINRYMDMVFEFISGYTEEGA